MTILEHVPFGDTFLQVAQTFTNELRVRKAVSSGGWIFSKWSSEILVKQLADWQKHYLPVSVKGKTVLDVGAGEGETAFFFLSHGAEKVICIECDGEKASNLQKNSFNHNIESYFRKFNLTDLDKRFDFLKMDIEGYEEALLGVNLHAPAVIEVHGLQLVDKFRDAGYRMEKAPSGLCRYAFWKC